MAARFPVGSQISSIEEECRDYLFSHMTAVAAKGNSDGELWSPRGIAIDSNTGKIYVAEEISRVTIFNETLEFLGTFMHKDMHSPWGIVIHNDSMYMTDTRRHSVLHFKVTGYSLLLINEVGEYGYDIYHFYRPRQLAVSTNGYVYVSDHLNHRIKVLDGDLRYIRHISHHSMTRPNDVKLTPDKVYVLSDFADASAHYIHIFTHVGEKIQSLIPREYDPGAQIGNTYFFCIDIRGNFVISVNFFSQILIFSEAGRLIYKLGFHERGLGNFCLHSLFGVTQTANGKLLVVCENGQKLLRMFSSLEQNYD